MTAEELKAILSTPAMLFGLMILASLTSALIEVGKAQKSGSATTFGSYLAHWPSTVGAFLGNVIAFVVLVMTDQLNFASALGIGYGVNNLVDMLPKNDRTELTMGTMKQSGHARVGMLLIITAIATSIMLQACANNNPVKTSVDLVVSACAKDGDYRVEDCVGSTLGVYEIWQRQGVVFVTNAATPAEVKTAIKVADAAATPVMLALRDAEKTYVAIKAEVAAGTTSDEQLLIAVRNLERYVLEAQPKIQALIRALGG